MTKSEAHAHPLARHMTIVIPWSEGVTLATPIFHHPHTGYLAQSVPSLPKP